GAADVRFDEICARGHLELEAAGFVAARATFAGGRSAAKDDLGAGDRAAARVDDSAGKAPDLFGEAARRRTERSDEQDHPQRGGAKRRDWQGVDVRTTRCRVKPGVHEASCAAFPRAALSSSGRASWRPR